MRRLLAILVLLSASASYADGETVPWERLAQEQTANNIWQSVGYNGYRLDDANNQLGRLIDVLSYDVGGYSNTVAGLLGELVLDMTNAFNQVFPQYMQVLSPGDLNTQIALHEEAQYYPIISNWSMIDWNFQEVWRLLAQLINYDYLKYYSITGINDYVQRIYHRVNSNDFVSIQRAVTNISDNVNNIREDMEPVSII